MKECGSEGEKVYTVWFKEVYHAFCIVAISKHGQAAFLSSPHTVHDDERTRQAYDERPLWPSRKRVQAPMRAESHEARSRWQTATTPAVRAACMREASD
eukprot:scaffold95091_cov27-Tisochrysis_lutea.AAC.2